MAPQQPIKATINFPQPPNPGQMAQEIIVPMGQVMQPQANDVAMWLLMFGIGVASALVTATTMVIASKMHVE